VNGERLYKFALVPGVVFAAVGVGTSWDLFLKRRRAKKAEEMRRRKFISWGWPRMWCEQY